MKQQVETDSPLMRKLIREYIPQANEHCQNQFVRYYELLIDYNNRMNLTAITGSVRNCSASFCRQSSRRKADSERLKMH